MTILHDNCRNQSIKDWVTKITGISVAFSHCLYSMILRRKEAGWKVFRDAFSKNQYV